MAKVTWTDKQSLYPPWDESYQLTNENINEVKASLNGLYDIVGAGAVTDNLIVVSINTGGATNKIKNTIDAITTSGPTNRYLVQVRPGTYIEDNFTVPEYVALIAPGTDRVTAIEANTTTGTLITVSANVSVIGFDITGKTSGTAIGIASAGGCKINDVTISECATGIYVNNAGAEAVLSVIDFGDNVATGIDLVAGEIDVKNIDVGGTYTVGTILSATGASSQVSLNDLWSISPNVTELCSLSGGCVFTGVIIQAQNFYDGIVIDGTGTDVKINSMKLLGAQNDGVRAEATATNVELSMFETTITGSGNYNVNFLSPTIKINGSGFTELSKVNVVPGTGIYASILDTTEGDEGINILGELHVGTPKRPTESAFGEGDSHKRFLAYTTTDDIAFTDISTEARSPSGSTFTFPSTAAGSSIYIGNLYSDSLDAMLPFFGIKTLVTVAAVLGAGNFTVQYYNSNSGWLDLNYMETQADRRFYQYGDNIFAHTGSHQVRFGINLAIETDVNLKWDTNDPVSYGTNIYWIRLRIENAITTAPIFEQIKVHSNRFEINSDGWMEFFGNARPQANLPVTLGAARELSGNMGDANIWIDQDLGEGLRTNQFNLLSQYFGISQILPDDIDTGSGIKLTLVCRGDGAGTVTFDCDYGPVTEGGAAYTTNPALLPLPTRKVATSSVTFTGANEVRFFEFDLDVQGYRSRKDPSDGETRPDILFFTINPTSLPVNVQMVAMSPYYYRWCSGGHI